MKMPVRPKTLRELMAQVSLVRLKVILNVVESPTVDGKYRHWDKLRYLETPPGLSHPEWWLGLKLRRSGSSPIPLRDKAGASFRLNMVDPLPEILHHVDSQARGAIQQPEPLTNPATRDQYLVRSLIEESITSSQLEGASTTRVVARKMLRENRAPRNRGERMIFNNYQTMQHILEIRDREITPSMICEIHRMVTDGTLDDPSGAGRFRRSDENIVVEDVEGQVLHDPPPADELERRALEMCAFANEKGRGEFLHPMVRSMILHFWLAYDHPFVDGNGRTARALFYWSMLKQGYWVFEYISISKLILRAPTKYERAFLETETDENDLTYFLIYHASIIRRAIDELDQDIDRHVRELAEAEKDLAGLAVLNHRQRELMSHALRHPGERYTTETHRNSHRVAYETARSDLMDLVDRGLLQKKKHGKSWVFSPAVDLTERLQRLD